jgi:hypothetical protein
MKPATTDCCIRKLVSNSILCIAYRCSSVETCNASVTTDPKGLAVVKTKNDYTHGKDENKAETRQLRVCVRHNSGDISQRPSKVIRGELKKNG